MSRERLFLCVLLLFILPSPLLAWQGKVIGISDGDTIRVLHDRQEIKIRLWGIDCPESHQDFGTRAKKYTSELAFGQIVEIEEVDKDRYGRTVALATLPDGKILNEALVSAGLAWVYTKYCNRPVECSRWWELERVARSQKTGLWSMPNAIPPWEFRRK